MLLNWIDSLNCSVSASYILFICFFVMYVFSLFLLSNAIFLPQAMDLYYHNESDPDSYCCPGDNSKSPATKPLVLYSSTSSRLSLFPICLSHRDSHFSVISLALSPGSFLFIICSFLYSRHQSKIISYHSFSVYFSLVCCFPFVQTWWLIQLALTLTLTLTYTV